MKANPTLLIALALTTSRLICSAVGQQGAERLATQSTSVGGPVAQALTDALAGPEGEYAARAEYAAILAKFGEVQPYTTIVQAEERHIAALKRHFEMRGLPVPEDPFGGKVQAPDTLQEAAWKGVKAEELNVAMYDRLLAATKGQRDLENVFTRLQWASREHHLPALKAAAENDGQLADGFTCGRAGGQGRGGPSPWAGGRRQRGQGGRGGCGGCGMGPASQGSSDAMPGRGYRWGQRRAASSSPSGN